jgi:hypothetical protein
MPAAFCSEKQNKTITALAVAERRDSNALGALRIPDTDSSRDDRPSPPQHEVA